MNENTDCNDEPSMSDEEMREIIADLKRPVERVLSRNTSDEVLRQCPFCGSTDVSIVPGDGAYYICCSGKCKRSYISMTWTDAIEVWNSRPIEDALRDEIAWLRAMGLG